jgi:hypothetical protein
VLNLIQKKLLDLWGVTISNDKVLAGDYTLVEVMPGKINVLFLVHALVIKFGK